MEDAIRILPTLVYLYTQLSPCPYIGQAAAGLTLNIARHVILLEPFLRPAEEQQAFNRLVNLLVSQLVS